ncbi:MAG: hypothetical protein D6785_13155, partial [Planctomycetota bacterium]
MKWLWTVLTSSVGRKFIMGLTGLFLCTFLVVHLMGNLQLLKGDGGIAFNHYSDFMSTNLGIRILEIGLVLGFLFHILDGISLTLKNHSARPERYYVNAGSANSSWTSRHMFFTGFLVLLFLGLHLWSFTIRHRVLHAQEPMFESVRMAFENPWYSAFYIFAFFLLGLHLHHGFQSAFQSLGLRHKKYTPLIQGLGLLFCILIPLGYASIPCYFLINKGKNKISKIHFQEEKLPVEVQKNWEARAKTLVAKEYPWVEKTRLLKAERSGSLYRLSLEVLGKKDSKKVQVQILVNWDTENKQKG